MSGALRPIHEALAKRSSMSLWRFSSPAGSRFATADRRGSWTSSATDKVCDECSASRQQRAKPLVMAWQPGSDEVGDFVWLGFGGEVVATRLVVDALQPSFGGFEPGPVEMVEDDDRASRRRERKVQLPYHGPELNELWVTSRVHLDRRRSSIELERRCAKSKRMMSYRRGSIRKVKERCVQQGTPRRTLAHVALGDHSRMR